MRTHWGHGIIAGVLSGLVMHQGTAVAQSAVPTGIAGRLIEHYHMQLVPEEGVWFSVTYASEDAIDGTALPNRYVGRAHAAGSAIVAVETPRYFSAMHRLQSDEVWHFYGGSPLQMVLLYPDGHGQTIVLGSNVAAGETPQLTVPHGVWQGSAPRAVSPASYSFVGTQLSPAFDYTDFEIGYRDELQRQYPAFSQDIHRLTRAEFAIRPAIPPSEVRSQASPGTVFRAQEVPQVVVSPGVTLQELVGRVARDAKTSSLSIAAFVLSPGRSTGSSFNHRSQEVFLVTAGSGLVHLGDQVVPVGQGSTMFIPAEVVHSIEANAGSTLSFYAISAPAYSPDDYVAIKY